MTSQNAKAVSTGLLAAVVIGGLAVAVLPTTQTPAPQNTATTTAAPVSGNPGGNGGGSSDKVYTPGVDPSPAHPYGPDGYRRLPDPALTPGVADPRFTLQDVCTPGFTKTVRNVPESEKKAAYVAYGITPKAGEHFEADHLESLELSGSNDPKNIWIEPYFGPWNAHDKDAEENRLHALICAGKMSQGEAQEAIRTNWIAEYRKLFGGPPKSAQISGN